MSSIISAQFMQKKNEAKNRLFRWYFIQKEMHLAFQQFANVFLLVRK
jgi:hypothetical protein